MIKTEATEQGSVSHPITAERRGLFHDREDRSRIEEGIENFLLL